jgi:hypothetical protein
MLHNTKLALPVLSLSILALANPLEQREAAPQGLIESLLGGTLSGVAQRIKDVLGGSTSAIDDTESNRPMTCSLPILNRDQCCVCKHPSCS